MYNISIDDDSMYSLRPHQQRTVDALRSNERGTVYIPTGGGKTLCMINDVINHLDTATEPQTIVVVAPRIMLAIQLCEEFMEQVKNANVLHVHSGETKHFKTTKSDRINLFTRMCHHVNEHVIIFSTYNSLHRIVDAGIKINALYCDEAHNSVQRNFFPVVALAAVDADRAFFFTATPKFAKNGKRGMNNAQIYGNNLITVAAQELIECGSIIPPTVKVTELPYERKKETVALTDANTVTTVVDSLDENVAQKVLVAAPSARIIKHMFANSLVLADLYERGYSVMSITSKDGAIIDGKKVTRDEFFNTLHAWGLDPNKNFVLFHYSILSEGINVPGLTHVILLRQLPVIEMAQTIGRVIRLDRQDAQRISSGALRPTCYANYIKPTGFVTVPVYQNTGRQISNRLQRVVDCVFTKGMPATSWV